MTPAAAPPGRPAGGGSKQARDAVVQAFLDHLRDERGLSGHTVAAYGSDLDRLRRGFTGDWADLDPAVLRRIAAGLARAGHNPRSVQRFLSAARSFGRWAVREGLEPGTRVIVAGAQALRAGTQVAVQPNQQ